jgi:hypothetical protein
MTERIVRVQGGREHEVYASLLDRAHKAGLKRIETELVWWPEKYGPSEGAYQGWICKATVEMEDGRIFEAHGDASPENVRNPKQVRPCAMAETRAKARALRDALNAGAEGFEGETPEKGAEAVRIDSRASDGRVANDSAGALTDESTERTELLDEITDLARKLGNDEEKIQEKLSNIIDKDMHDLERYASVMRTRLLERQHEMKGAAKA